MMTMKKARTLFDKASNRIDVLGEIAYALGKAADEVNEYQFDALYDYSDQFQYEDERASELWRHMRNAEDNLQDAADVLYRLIEIEEKKLARMGDYLNKLHKQTA